MRSLGIALPVLLLLTALASAQQGRGTAAGSSGTVSLGACGTFPTVRVLLDGKEIDTQAIVRNGLTYISVRDAAEHLGATVTWMPSQDVFYIRYPQAQRIVQASSGSRTVRVYNYSQSSRNQTGSLIRTVRLPVACFECAGRTYAPLRAGAELLGVRIDYDAKTNTISAYSPPGAHTTPAGGRK